MQYSSLNNKLSGSRQMYECMNAAYNFHCHEADADQHVDFLLALPILILDGSEDAGGSSVTATRKMLASCWFFILRG
jgi:hypothetical protein